MLKAGLKAGGLAFGAASLASQAAPANEVWLAGLDPYGRQAVTPGAPSDYADLFLPNAPWQQAAMGTKVFKATTQWMWEAPDASLRQMFAFLKQNGIALAVAAAMIPAPGTCGAGVEGYIPAGAVARWVNRIKALGGDLKYVAMDEPLWFGHHYSGSKAPCNTPIPDLAQAVAKNVAVIHAAFPNVFIGDMEPLTLATVPDWLTQLTAFASAYQSATGAPLDFIQADIQWNKDYVSEIRQFTQAVRAAGIKVGLIYNAQPTDQTDLVWTREAETHFTTVEADPSLIPDQAVIESWTPIPSKMLPETQPGTLTNLVDRYLAMRTTLSLQVAGTTLTGTLAKEGGAPVMGQPVYVNATDTSAAGIPITETMTGVVPANAASAMWAMRINTECGGCSGPANITVGTMNYKDPGHTASRTFPRSVYTATSGQTWAPTSTPFPVTANQPFTLTVPMQIPYASRNSGYIALIWLDANGNGINPHAEMPFQPAVRPVGAFVTDANGRFTTAATLTNVIYNAQFGGSVEWDRQASATAAPSSTTVVTQRVPVSNSHVGRQRR